jgi:hypothetical protein
MWGFLVGASRFEPPTSWSRTINQRGMKDLAAAQQPCTQKDPEADAWRTLFNTQEWRREALCCRRESSGPIQQLPLAEYRARKRGPQRPAVLEIGRPADQHVGRASAGIRARTIEGYSADGLLNLLSFAEYSDSGGCQPPRRMPSCPTTAVTQLCEAQ